LASFLSSLLLVLRGRGGGGGGSASGEREEGAGAARRAGERGARRAAAIAIAIAGGSAAEQTVARVAAMEDLVPVVNKLQDVFASIGQTQRTLDLPQIVVIGSQSSGKSSVLENVVGKGFLPRGAGICTRRPLVLQLYHEEGTEEWAEFLHLPGQKLTDFDEVRNEIEQETLRETGDNKGISNKAIRLRVHSPNVLNLTLIDLPGITKVPIGDQPGNIETLIRDMCLEYVSNPLSIILAVSPANSDLANSDALKLAREVDPAGERTIGVLTKIDLVDDGVDVLDALSGALIPLKRGYVGIVNRSQAEIAAGTPIEDARKKERSFFLNHPSYRSIAARQGTEYLTRRLTNMLLDHIRDHLPNIKNNVQKQLRDVERELEHLGSAISLNTDRTSQGQLILSLLGQYANTFIDSMEGRQAPDMASTVPAHFGLFGGARLSQSFRQFSEQLQMISPFQDLTDGDIGTAIMNATGPRPSLFVPELSFEHLVKRQLEYLQEPAMSCVLDVFEILQEVADQSCSGSLNRFTNLHDRVCDTVKQILKDNLAPTQAMIANLIHIEQAFINTSHPDFVNQLPSIRSIQAGDGLFQFDASASRMKNAESSASVVSITSDSRQSRAKVPSNSVDIDGFPDLQDSASTTGVPGGSTASSDDGRELSPGNAPSSSTPYFMRFIFNERSGINSAPGSLAGNKNSSGSRVASTFPRGSLLNDYLTEESEADNQVAIIKRLIDAYLSISRKNILDLTPKTIMHFLVNNVKEHLHTELIRALYKEELFDELLQEDESVAQARESYKETHQLLSKAMSVLSTVREFKV